MKQWFTLNRDEWLIILASYPVVLIVNCLMLGESYFTHSFVFLPITATTSLLFICFAWLMDAWTKYVQHQFPSLLMYIAATLVLVALIFGIYEWANVPGYQFRMANYGWVALIGIVLNILSAGVFDAIYFYQQ